MMKRFSFSDFRTEVGFEFSVEVPPEATLPELSEILLEALKETLGEGPFTIKLGRASLWVCDSRKNQIGRIIHL